ncbi:glycosyl-4,4'-diaponeurosporenoate acyltransferase CrtO family protein [Deinococcus aerophilus]|uniref:Glycosyl-4,4'-diaponeurosporenoate acyltransferase n=1 Tax=Deinococcus aerophilus TaxID=522488 RepID=A0ABQ2GJ70_9DEIO|nr:hypothetical protein [Deinococcus aerophilus]GGL98320.1 hypothetical protein GCM10010841_03370 [Deinococcus aerophilus]
MVGHGARTRGAAAWGRVALAALPLVGAAWVWGRVMGIHHLGFVLGLQVLLMWWALYLLHTARPGLRGGWFHVHGWEDALYQRLGVRAFGTLLRTVGWERVRQRARGFDGTRASLRRLEHSTREAEYSHLLLALVCVALSGGFAGWGAPDTAGWLLLTTVPVHLYPALLQRSVRGRLQRAGISP